MTFWTSTRVETLKMHWAAGTSVRAIAAQLGTGRNAVIGKANRIGLAVHAAARLRKAPIRSAATKKKKMGGGRRARRRAPSRGPATPLSAEARPIRFADLAPDHCRYAVTADQPFLFCGDVRQVSSPYCRLHHALCYAKARGDGAQPAVPRRPWSRLVFLFGQARAALPDNFTPRCGARTGDRRSPFRFDQIKQLWSRT